MRLAWLSVAFALVWLCAPAWPQSAKKKSPARKGATTAPSKKPTTTARKSAAPSKAGQAKSNTARRRTRARPVYRVSQQTPSRERYADIQKALAEKGYYQDEPDGNWGESSIAALKKFQDDQNLKPDGKLNSLSLIALGLGPKHTAAAYPPKSLGDPVNAPDLQPTPPVPSESTTPAGTAQPPDHSPLAQPPQ